MVLVKETGITRGELTACGYPFYAGTVEMEVEFDFLHKADKSALQMEWLNPSVCHVELNGKNCGSIYAAPYRLDVSKYLRYGKNHLKLTLSNTLRNMLGPYHRPNGEMGCLFSNYADTDGPWVWNPETDRQWQDRRDCDHASWTDSYLCVPFGIGRMEIIFQ